MRHDVILHDRLTDELTNARNAAGAAADEESPATAFDPSILVPILIEVIVAVLSGCPLLKSPLTLARSFSSPSLLQRAAIMARLRQNRDVPRELLGISRDAIVNVMSAAAPSEVVGFIGEMNEVQNDWSPWS